MKTRLILQELLGASNNNKIKRAKRGQGKQKKRWSSRIDIRMLKTKQKMNDMYDRYVLNVKYVELLNSTCFWFVSLASNTLDYWTVTVFNSSVWKALNYWAVQIHTPSFFWGGCDVLVVFVLVLHLIFTRFSCFNCYSTPSFSSVFSIWASVVCKWNEHYVINAKF